MNQDRRFAHVCLVVRDIHKAIDDYRRILSVVDPQQVEQEIVYYDDFGVGDERLAFATFPSLSGGCEIQFMQPKTPGTPLYRRLEKLGEHVHHVCFTSPDVTDVTKELNEAGIDIVEEGVSHDPQIPWQYWSFVDPELTHGVLVELANHYRSVDGKWVAANESVVDVG